MEHTERPRRHGGILYPLLLVAAIAVIVFSIIGIATMTGLMPNAATRDGDGAARQSGSEPKGKPARMEAPRPEPTPRLGNPRTATTGGEDRELLVRARMDRGPDWMFYAQHRAA